MKHVFLIFNISCIFSYITAMEHCTGKYVMQHPLPTRSHELAGEYIQPPIYSFVLRPCASLAKHGEVSMKCRGIIDQGIRSLASSNKAALSTAISTYLRSFTLLINTDQDIVALQYPAPHTLLKYLSYITKKQVADLHQQITQLQGYVITMEEQLRRMPLNYAPLHALVSSLPGNKENLEALLNRVVTEQMDSPNNRLLIGSITAKIHTLN